MEALISILSIKLILSSGLDGTGDWVIDANRIYLYKVNDI